jgi:hypothetical protein
MALIIFTVTYPAHYQLAEGCDVQFNHATKTARFRDAATRQYIEIPIEDIDYIANQIIIKPHVPVN